MIARSAQEPAEFSGFVIVVNVKPSVQFGLMRFASGAFPLLDLISPIEIGIGEIVAGFIFNPMSNPEILTVIYIPANQASSL
jgi:hypothetical protein